MSVSTSRLGDVRRTRRRVARWVAAATVAVLIVVGAIITAVVSSSPVVGTRSQFVAGTPEARAPVGLDTTVYFPATTPAPAVLLAHGFGGSKADLDPEARSLAEHGYVVLAYTARGFGRSGGLIHLDAPAYEIADASKLISYLATLPQVTRDAAGDPRVGVAGSSYGGGLALLLGADDKRVDSIGADITWNDLSQALFPNAAGPAASIVAPAFRNKQISIIGYSNFLLSTEVRAAGYERLAAHAAAGELTVQVERYSLDELPVAWRRLTAGSSSRKLVVVPGQKPADTR